MKNRPKGLVFLAMFLLVMSLFLPLINHFVFEPNLGESGAVVNKLNLMNALIMVLAPLTSILIFRASPWLIVTLPVLVSTVVHSNWLASDFGNDYSPLVVGLATGIFLLAIGFVLTRDLRQFLIHPEKRWWLTAQRKRTELKAHITTQAKRLIDLQTVDVSEKGAFLTGKGFESLRPGDMFEIQLELNGQTIHCKAHVVRQVTNLNNQQPAGIGVRFHDLNIKSRIALHQFMKHTPEHEMTA